MLNYRRGAGLIMLIFGIALLAFLYNMFFQATPNTHRTSDNSKMSTNNRSAMESSYEVTCRANILSISQQLHIYELSNPTMKTLDLPKLFHPGRYPMPNPGSGCSYVLRDEVVYCVKHSNH